MDLLQFLKWLNNDFLALPVTLLFFGVAIVLTVKTGFLQIRAFPRFMRLIINGVGRKNCQLVLENKIAALFEIEVLLLECIYSQLLQVI